MKRKVKHGLRLPVGVAQGQSLEPEDAPVQHMGINAAYHLCLEAGLGQVRVVYQTLESPFRAGPCPGSPQKAHGHPVDKLAPVDAVLFQETVEHVLLAGNELRKAGMAVLERIPHHEEREEQQQFQHLEAGEFAVVPLLNPDAGEIEVQAGDCTHYTIDCPVAIIFGENESISEIICLPLAIAFSIEYFFLWRIKMLIFCEIQN